MQSLEFSITTLAVVKQSFHATGSVVVISQQKAHPEYKKKEHKFG